MAGLIRYNNADVVVDTQKVVTSTWSNNTNNLQTSHTSSTQANLGSPTSSGAFYIEVYNAVTSSTSAAVQYAAAYGHKEGSGSQDFTNDVGAYGNSPSRVIYNQYRQLVFGDETSNFSFDGHTPDDIYVINTNRARFKQNLKPGSLDFKLSGSGLGLLELTDDSVSVTGSSTITNAGRQFNIVSGSGGLRSGSLLTQVTNSGSYGFFYPDSGFIILNPAAVDHHISELIPGIDSHSIENNHQKLVTAISGGAYFIVDSEEKVTSQYYFTRVRNNEFNYTTNPSFTDEQGNLSFTSMIDSPKVYITTVGMYNDNNDLVAVAKLSQPISKDFTKESLIRVKLDY